MSEKWNINCQNVLKSNLLLLVQVRFGKLHTRNGGREREDARIGCKDLHRRDKSSYERDKIFFLDMSTFVAV